MLRKKRTAITTLVVTALLAAGALSWVWTAVRTDRAMRADLLQRTRRMAQRVDLKLVQLLASTPADPASPACQQLQQQLTTLRTAIPPGHSLQLVGCRANGTLFPLVDERPAGHAAGAQTGRRNAAGLRHVFATGVAETAGPLTGPGGSFVSGAVPLSTPGAGHVIAVLCLEMETQVQNWKEACHAALPAGISLVLLVVTLCTLLVTRRHTALFRPTLWRHSRPW